MESVGRFVVEADSCIPGKHLKHSQSYKTGWKHWAEGQLHALSDTGGTGWWKVHETQEFTTTQHGHLTSQPSSPDVYQITGMSRYLSVLSCIAGYCSIS